MAFMVGTGARHPLAYPVGMIAIVAVWSLVALSATRRTGMTHLRHQLDPVVHFPIRLAIMACLMEVDEAKFSVLARTVEIDEHHHPAGDHRRTFVGLGIARVSQERSLSRYDRSSRSGTDETSTGLVQLGCSSRKARVTAANSGELKML
jgi:hypothetical protein